MAIGDDALAAGMTILDGSEQADDIDLEINRTRDFIAQRTSAVVPVLKGGTGATDAAGARANLDAVSSAQLATKAAASHIHDALYGTGGMFGWRPAPYYEWNTANNMYVGGYLNVQGTIFNPSTERVKSDIHAAPNLTGLWPELKEYERNGVTELGYLAEDFVGTDAERFVKFDADGKPEALAYQSLLVAQVAQLRAIVLDLAARIAELED